MEVLLHPTYFPNIVSMACLARGPVIWEGWDNFQKQPRILLKKAGGTPIQTWSRCSWRLMKY